MIQTKLSVHGNAQKIRAARFSPQCSVLGPGKRGVLWVQGCERHCPGCTAPETWDPEGGSEVSTDFLAEYFTSKKELEGLTFSGGEPMLQAEALTELMEACRRKRPDFTFMAYSGFTLEELMAEADPSRLEMLARLDLLIDGPYLEEAHENLLWRGSRNQRVWFLTKRYEAEWGPKIFSAGVQLELEVEQDSIHCMGIPPKNFRRDFEEIVRSLLKEEKD